MNPSNSAHESAAEETYTIVVLGAMNPAIHHPGWYQLVGIMTPEEAEEAHKDAAAFSSARVSQFSFGSITVTCDPSRWQVQTNDQKELPRAVSIAEKTFQILYHTPVSVFGLNFMYHRPTKLSKVNNALARLVEGLPLELSASRNEERAAKLTYEHGAAGRIMRIAIEPSVRGESLVYIGINVDHRQPVLTEGEYKQWDLKLDEHFPRDFADAKRQLASILDAVNRLEEGPEN